MANSDGRLPKDWWDKLPILSVFLASVAVPVVIAVVGHWYTAAIKDRELKISEQTFNREYVQLGLSILRDPDTASYLRKWGVKIVSEFAPVKMEDDTKVALVDGAVLPEAVSSNTQSEGAVSATSRTKAIGDLQTQGIRALLDKDLSTAILAYDHAYQLWPTFRNVDEIRRALVQADKPGELDWRQLYGRIASMDLRGVSEDVQAQLAAAAGSR